MYQPGEEFSELSAADLSDKLYHIAKTDSTGKIVLASAGTDAIEGVIHDGGRKSGDTVTVQAVNGSGSFKVKAGGTIAKNALLTSDANGKAVTATSGDRVFGRARRAAVANDIVEYTKMNEKA